MSKKNQPAALKLIGAIATGYKALLPVFTSINNEQDSNLISQLQKTENMNILTQIAALYAAWINHIIRIFIRITLRN